MFCLNRADSCVRLNLSALSAYTAPDFEENKKKFFIYGSFFGADSADSADRGACYSLNADAAGFFYTS